MFMPVYGSCMAIVFQQTPAPVGVKSQILTVPYYPRQQLSLLHHQCRTRHCGLGCFGNSSTSLVSIADLAPFTDIVVCDLVPTDDLGNPTAEERDPWEEEEDAARLTILLPVLQR